MRAVVQRVFSASVSVDGNTVSSIDEGLLVFLGVGKEDNEATAAKIAKKIAGLRIFRDDNDKMSRSVKDVGGKILLISNFTLYGSVRHGFRPDFMKSATGAVAEPLYEYVISLLNETVECKGGVFGGDMRVKADNNGPVTIIIDTDEL
ncbi:MAG: D-tyrosyl-tRNA(Tyr) deacylase [Clostridia bacterium]|nr:D-tyrosyl-tRNA(Tyr) deacylase [Clostridia bacterium]